MVAQLAMQPHLASLDVVGCKLPARPWCSGMHVEDAVGHLARRVACCSTPAGCDCWSRRTPSHFHPLRRRRWYQSQGQEPIPLMLHAQVGCMQAGFRTCPVRVCSSGMGPRVGAFVWNAPNPCWSSSPLPCYPSTPEHVRLNIYTTCLHAGKKLDYMSTAQSHKSAFKAPGHKLVSTVSGAAWLGSACGCTGAKLWGHTKRPAPPTAQPAAAMMLISTCQTHAAHAKALPFPPYPDPVWQLGHPRAPEVPDKLR